MREPWYCKTRLSDEVTVPTTAWGNVPFRGFGMVQLYRLETHNAYRDVEGAMWLLFTRVSLQTGGEDQATREDIQIIGHRNMAGDQALESAVQKASAYFENQFQIDVQNMLAEWMVSNNQVADIQATPTPPELLENDGDA